MPNVYEKNMEAFELMRKTLDSLLENDEQIDVNSTEDLIEKFNEYTEDLKVYEDDEENETV